jgi:hypothetical protein
VCKARSLLLEGLNSGGFYHWAGIKENALTINIIIVPDFKKWTTGKHIRHQCRKTTVLCCHRCLINPRVEKMNNI